MLWDRQSSLGACAQSLDPPRGQPARGFKIPHSKDVCLDSKKYDLSQWGVSLLVTYTAVTILQVLHTSIEGPPNDWLWTVDTPTA